jgi:hypothetical protein
MRKRATRRITPLGMFLGAHWLGVLMAIAGMVPVLNRLYSGHGGLAWFVLPVVFPLAVATYVVTYWLSEAKDRPLLRDTMKRSLIAYVMFTLSGSFVASLSIGASYGLELPPLQLWGMFFFPLNVPALMLFGVIE